MAARASGIGASPVASVARVAQSPQFGEPRRIVGGERFLKVEAVGNVAHHLPRLAGIFLRDDRKGVDQLPEEAFLQLFKASR